MGGEYDIQPINTILKPPPIFVSKESTSNKRRNPCPLSMRSWFIFEFMTLIKSEVSFIHTNLWLALSIDNKVSHTLHKPTLFTKPCLLRLCTLVCNAKKLLILQGQHWLLDWILNY